MVQETVTIIYCTYECMDAGNVFRHKLENRWERNVHWHHHWKVFKIACTNINTRLVITEMELLAYGFKVDRYFTHKCSSNEYASDEIMLELYKRAPLIQHHRKKCLPDNFSQRCFNRLPSHYRQTKVAYEGRSEHPEVVLGNSLSQKYDKN